MKIGFVFYGIPYGEGSKTEKDFRHCWPGIKKDLIDPFVSKGHIAKVYASIYPIEDKKVEKEFYDMLQPEKVYYSNFEGSDPFTCKGAAFNAFENEDLDFIIFTRLDIHFSKIIANENINFDKFNFLYPEGGRGSDYWWEILRFTTDNFYAWPHKFTWQVKESLLKTYRNLRPESPDTHPLIHKLLLKIGNENIHFISNIPEPSDVSSYYTLCRDGIPTSQLMHTEVIKRFYLKGCTGPLLGI
jgi:hypothetical protein